MFTMRSDVKTLGSEQIFCLAISPQGFMIVFKDPDPFNSMILHTSVPTT